MGLRRQGQKNRGILYGVMCLLVFFVGLLLVFGGIWLFRERGDFYSAFRGQLSRGFYLSAILVLLFSSVLYTPFSYGVSFYFLSAFKGDARFCDLFFLFRRPLLLGKAIMVSGVKKVLIWWERLLVLLVAAMGEVGLFFLFMVVSGEDVFTVSGNPFTMAAEFMLRSPWLIGLSVALWSVVLFLFLLIYLRYILCKYVLLEYPDASVFQAIQVGKGALRGHLWRTLLFYLRYGAFCCLKILSFGLYREEKPFGFSVYGAGLAREGWRNYCRKRSLR